MGILNKKTITQASASTEGKATRAKAKTQAEKFQGFIDDVIDTLRKDSSELLNTQADNIGKIMNRVVSRHVKVDKSASGAGQGVFYSVWGENPIVGDTRTSDEVTSLSDNTANYAEAVLKRWADPSKGVPYGRNEAKGRVAATAVIKFYKRYRLPSGDWNAEKAYYVLEDYREYFK